MMTRNCDTVYLKQTKPHNVTAEIVLQTLRKH